MRTYANWLSRGNQMNSIGEQNYDKYHINDFTWIAQYITDIVTSILTPTVLITLRYIHVLTYIRAKGSVTVQLIIILLSRQL